MAGSAMPTRAGTAERHTNGGLRFHLCLSGYGGQAATANVARIKRSVIRGKAAPAFRHSASKTRVNALMAQCGLRL
jgi:hypothetical protein